MHRLRVGLGEMGVGSSRGYQVTTMSPLPMIAPWCPVPYGGCTGQKIGSEKVRLVVTAVVRALRSLHLHPRCSELDVPPTCGW